MEILMKPARLTIATYWIWAGLFLFLPLPSADAKKKDTHTSDHLAEYVARVRAATVASPITGNIWTQQSPYTDMASDYKARNINDLIVIQVVEQTTAAADG